MESEKINYFEKVDTTLHREFVISQNNCVLCGTVLELHHQIDLDGHKICEEAHCLHCKVKVRTKQFALN